MKLHTKNLQVAAEAQFHPQSPLSLLLFSYFTEEHIHFILSVFRADSQAKHSWRYVRIMIPLSCIQYD